MPINGVSCYQAQFYEEMIYLLFEDSGNIDFGRAQNLYIYY